MRQRGRRGKSVSQTDNGCFLLRTKDGFRVYIEEAGKGSGGREVSDFRYGALIPVAGICC